MEAETTCIYAKYGKCKKEDCNFHHPQEICCDKTCDVHLCVKKHPRHCRYFWGFNSCRNEESCKFLHSKDHTYSHVKQNEALEQKYDELLGQFKHCKNVCNKHDEEINNLKKQLEQQAHHIHILKTMVLNSLGEVSQYSIPYESDVSTHDVTQDHDDDEDTQMIKEVSTEALEDTVDMEQENYNVDHSDNPRTNNLPKNSFQQNILNIKYLEAEIIKIKDFVSSERMVAKRMNQTRQKLKTLSNEMKTKFGRSKSEKKLNFEIETLSEKVIKIRTNFKTNVNNELEKCAEKCRTEIVKMENKLLTAGR